MLGRVDVALEHDLAHVAARRGEVRRVDVIVVYKVTGLAAASRLRDHVDGVERGTRARIRRTGSGEASWKLDLVNHGVQNI